MVYRKRHAAFTKVKTTVANATMLAHPSHKGPDFAVGTVHEQWMDGSQQPFAFLININVPVLSGS